MRGGDGMSAKQLRYQESAKRNIMWHLENSVYDYETLKKIEAFVIKEVTA